MEKKGDKKEIRVLSDNPAKILPANCGSLCIMIKGIAEDMMLRRENGIFI